MTLAMRTPMFLLMIVLGTGCHRLYVIRGNIVVVAQESAHEDALPAVLCSGHGGPLETSGVYGSPVVSSESREATIFCRRPSEPMTFSLHESIYYGSVPRRAHVYSWLAPVPGAKDICTRAEGPAVKIAYRDLDQLMSPVESKKPPNERTLVGRPCGETPKRSMPLAFAITFDPKNRTWVEESGGVWIEERSLRIK